MATARKTADDSWNSGPKGVLPTLEEWAQSQRDWDWFHKNKESLLQHYPEQWVAVRNERVIAHEASLDKFIRELNKTDDSKGLAVRELITAQEPLWMLGHWRAPQS